MKGETQRLVIAYAARTGAKSQRQIARALGVTPQSVSLLLKGQRTMSTDTALVVCSALEIDVADTLRRLASEREQRGPKQDQAGSSQMVNNKNAARRLHQKRLF